MTKMTLSLNPATGANISPAIRSDYSMWCCDHGIDATEWIATGGTQSRENQYYISIVGERAREYYGF